ncbi:MAG: PAS domain-containing sensor histidine kinase [Clostridiales bacterium]|nr:PAS domain-containing sensor histidine kinase [Clostridiales bacterium]
MTKRIFKSICVATIVVFMASLMIIMSLLYDHFTQMQQDDLKILTANTSRGIEISGADYFEGIKLNNYRITWIDIDGTVLLDSQANASEMENHGDRQEVVDALRLGYGESTRFSTTLLEKQIYSAQRIADGSVVRISRTQSTSLAFMLQMIQPTAVIIVIALVLSLILASHLSKLIVKPLNSINLDEPLANENYEELAPLFTRLEYQRRQINKQVSELKRRQDEFEAITGSMTEGLVLLNSKDTIISINKSAMKLLGTDKSCIGQNILTINRTLELQDLLRTAQNGEKVEKIIELGSGDYELVASPVVSNGANNGVALLIFDVTEKMNAEQRRREFTANVSHELRTPLHSISGHAELMRSGMVKSEDVARFTDQIYFEAQRLSEMVDDIIRLSRLDEGTEDMTREEIDLMSVAQDVVNSLEPTAKEKEIMVTLQGDKAIINGIPHLISGIVYNLCDNAIRYNKQAGKIDITITDKADKIILTVADTGMGIPETQQGRVFERFYRAEESHHNKICGSGLGLSIVKHSVRLHNGSIKLDSTVGKGTTITVTFPK